MQYLNLKISSEMLWTLALLLGITPENIFAWINSDPKIFLLFAGDIDSNPGPV